MNAIVISALLGVVVMFAGLLMKNSKQVQWVALISIMILMGATLFDNHIISSCWIIWFFDSRI